MNPKIWTAVVNMRHILKILVIEIQRETLYDESGLVCYQYGNMGEITRETRIYTVPFLSNIIALSTQFEYDSWGRILNITYPDNEEVNYSYDFGGQLERIANNQNYTYLDSVQYNKFGVKTSQLYGNGIKTNYTYYPLTQRLDSMLTTYSGNTLSYLQYTYDSVGNIIRVNSSYPMPQYQVTERYSYDSADQLLTAESTCNNNLLCSGAYSYNNWGKINTYTQQTTDPATNTSENKDYRYYFPSSSADMAQGQTSFAPIIKYDMQQNTQPLETCTYGINGSIRKRYDHPTQNTDYYYFNTSGNLKACGTDMQISVYGYNSANTRTYKVNLFNANQWVNGQPQPIQPMVQSAMFYPNTYINFTQAGEYTKHYYNGTERICSRLGEQQIPISVENNQELEAYKQDVKQIIYNAIGQHLYDEPTDMQEGDVIPLEYLQVTGDNNAVYYYHPNHLASTIYVTDAQQSVVQSFLYAPYGDIISEYNANFGSSMIPKYSFNAKELDEETGMYYYEARYYAPPTFTSRDPMFEKYFWMSPYAYCANNPVKYVDPSGMEGIVVSGGEYDDENRYKYNFIEPAITKLKELKAAGGSEPITWIVATAGYSESDLASFKKIADELGVGFQTISSADEFTNYLNSKDVNTTNLSDARKKDKITSMSIFGHGYVGSVEFAHNQNNQNNFSWGIDKVNQLVASAFNNARVDFYTCNSATDTETRKSLGYVFSKQTGSIVTGFRGQSTYSQMNNGQGFSAKWNRNKNGFNTNGSIALPQTGKDAVRVRYTHQTPKKK